MIEKNWSATVPTTVANEAWMDSQCHQEKLKLGGMFNFESLLDLNAVMISTLFEQALFAASEDNEDAALIFYGAASEVHKVDHVEQVLTRVEALQYPSETSASLEDFSSEPGKTDSEEGTTSTATDTRQNDLEILKLQLEQKDIEIARLKEENQELLRKSRSEKRRLEKQNRQQATRVNELVDEKRIETQALVERIQILEKLVYRFGSGAVQDTLPTSYRSLCNDTPNQQLRTEVLSFFNRVQRNNRKNRNNH